MYLKQSFEELISNYDLTQTQRDRIVSAHNTVRTFLKGHSELSGKDISTYLQGSYALHTGVNPQPGHSFDVDVVLELNLKDMEGDEVIEWLEDVFRTSANYKDRIASPAKNRCVRLEYADDGSEKGFHMDITPARPSTDTDDLEGTVEVVPDWKKSNSKKFIEWHKDFEKSHTYFRFVVILLKLWRNLHYGDESSPRSILLTVLVSKFIPKDSFRIEDALVATMDGIARFLKDQDEVPEVLNPVFEGTECDENLSGSWSQKDYDQFKIDLALALKLAKEAIDENTSEERAIELWSDLMLFGDCFPQKVRGLATAYKQFADANRTKAVSMTAAGILSASKASVASPIAVRPNKFYGDTEKEG